MDRDKKMKPSQRFRVEVIEQYEFLKGVLGFEGPDVNDDVIGYHSGRASIYVMYDDFDSKVITVVTRQVGELRWRAELSCLYDSAAMGPRQDIKKGARTSRLVAESIASQSENLRLVLPLLDGPNGDQLLKSCHARY